MSVLPLERYELFRSGDLDEARELVGRVFCEHRLNLVGRERRLAARMHSRRIGRITANYVTYGGNVIIEPGWLDTFYVVQIPLAGRSLVHYQGQRIYSTPVLGTVISPTEYLRQVWTPDCAQIILRIERSALQARLRDLLGVSLWEPLVFEPGFDVTTGVGASWLRAFTWLIEEMDYPQTLLNWRYSAEQSEISLMTHLLLAQPHNYSKLLQETTPMIVPSRPVNVARELIEAHPEWPLTVPGLARAANVSERTLQTAFSRYMNQSPKAYLLDVRMQRAHDELRAAEQQSVTVAHVARRLGFTHIGRFAAEYRRRYGESPSDTLRH